MTRVTDDVRSDNTTRSTDERAHNDDGALAGLDLGPSRVRLFEYARRRGAAGTSRNMRTGTGPRALNRNICLGAEIGSPMAELEVNA